MAESQCVTQVGICTKSGRPRTLDDRRVADLLNQALQTRPVKQTHWSVRNFAAEANTSKDMAHRLFRAAGIAPHRSRSLKLSNDPAFVEKVRDITGLYPNPPDHALVLCVDEKSQIRALERAQPVPPMGLGYVAGVTHDYVRHGTTMLFAALDPGISLWSFYMTNISIAEVRFMRQLRSRSLRDASVRIVTLRSSCARTAFGIRSIA
jgi:hypothetical protein